MCLQEKYPWIDTATSEDFPTEDLKLMASIIGMSATIKLLTEATGCVFTMTKYWDRELIKRYIKRVYDGTKRSRIEHFLFLLHKYRHLYILLHLYLLLSANRF